MYIYSCWLSEHVYKTQSGQCTLYLDMTFYLAFIAFPDVTCTTCQEVVFKLLCPEKILEKVFSVNV